MSITSRAITYSSPFAACTLNERTISLPPPANSVVVELYAMALNPVDVKLKGVMPFGGVLGRDFAGIVRHAGTEAEKKFKVGDKVSGFIISAFPKGFVGSYALIDVDNEVIGHTPEQFNNIQAAAAPLTLLTAWELLKSAQISPAGKILVLGGATAVGTFAIQLLKQKYNVAKVVATCSERSAEYVKSYGADETVDYSGDLPAKLLETVHDGKYVAIIDTVGDGSVGWIANQLVAEPWVDSSKCNFTSCAGATPPDQHYSVAGLLLGLPKIAFRMLFGRFWGIRYGVHGANKDGWPEVLEYLESNTIRVPIDSVTPFSDALKAVDRASSIGARGKIVIEF